MCIVKVFIKKKEEMELNAEKNKSNGRAIKLIEKD